MTMGTGRLESFSDGVFAVAATLLVLNIAVPPPLTTPHLGHALGAQWPIYAAYVTSFATIGIIWMNHHAMIGRLAKADQSIVMLNLLLLLTVGVIPFGTALIATYLRQGSGEHLAAGIYAGIFLAMSLAFSLVNRQILFRRPQLMKEQLTHKRRRTIFTRATTGIVPYVIAAALAPVSAYATLAIMFAIAGLYTLPVISNLGEGAG
jgi:uncharacterized membrane protein